MDPVNRRRTNRGSSDHLAVPDVKDGTVPRTSYLGPVERTLIERTPDVSAPSIESVQNTAHSEHSHRRAVDDHPYGMPLGGQWGFLHSERFRHRFTPSQQRESRISAPSTTDPSRLSDWRRGLPGAGERPPPRARGPLERVRGGEAGTVLSGPCRPRRSSRTPLARLAGSPPDGHDTTPVLPGERSPGPRAG